MTCLSPQSLHAANLALNAFKFAFICILRKPRQKSTTKPPVIYKDATSMQNNSTGDVTIAMSPNSLQFALCRGAGESGAYCHSPIVI
mmetsp:Transcript_20967/g.43899  ORF Transcript_20967/g.43899 Transcript_20967/m.43899 type:complete len:87 (-) Transcript_20967:455-715(-)